MGKRKAAAPTTRRQLVEGRMFPDGCSHSLCSLNGDGQLQCSYCGKVEPEPVPFVESVDGARSRGIVRGTAAATPRRTKP